MSDDAGLITVLPADLAPPPSLLEAAPGHVAPAPERPDPLDGLVLVGGVLAPLPPRVRLPHEDPDAEQGEGEEGPG